MKMASPVLRWRWLCSSSSSPGLNRNLLSRAFSASEPSRLSKISVESESKPKVKSSGGKTGEGLMDEAKRSENWKLFKSWMSKNNRSYRSEKKMLHRFQIFGETLKWIEKKNKESSGCTFGLTCFADMSPDKDHPLGYCPPPGKRPYKLSLAARGLNYKKNGAP